MSEILPPVIINNSPNIIIPTLHEDGNQVGPLFQTGTQGPVGPMGPQGPNIISEETQSDGTANISIAGLTIGDSLTLNGENYSYSSDSLVAHRIALNIDEVDNTNDLDKPISTATQTALNNKVDKVEGKELSDENFTSTEKSKLSGIEEGAEVNVNADWTATSGDAEILNKPTLGSAAAANTTDFATSAQGELADSALQPQSVNYLGEYNNGADYNPGAVVLYAGILYIRVGEANPGYPPGTSYWAEYNPEIGSPAYDLYVQTTLANKSNVGHSHSSNDITDFNSAASDAAPVQSINDRVGDIVLTKSDVGLDNVDNTSDADKPISNATQIALNNKVDVVIGKGLSDENFTSAEKIKLGGIAEGAEVNVNADWNATSGDAQILNKPSTIAGYNITDAVATSGAQYIDGVKTFTSSPLVPDLTVNSSSSSAVNKAYVDNVATGIHVHGEVHVILKNSTLASASGGTVAYTNGNNGIGAKLTITGGSSVVDALNAACGTDPDLTIGSRVIIAGETNTAWNGIYVITATRELTRATDADTPAKMNGGDFVFVTHGTIHADTGWICSEPVTTVGVSPVIFVQFSGSGAYDAGVGLQRDGTLFSVKTPVGGSIIADANGINLGASGVTPNTYGSSTQSAVVTVNDKGLVTGASSSTITPALDSITGLGSNVAAFLADPTSAKLAAAVVNSKTGTDALVFGTAPTISSPTINTAITLNTTTYSYGAGAAAAHRSALGLGTAATTDSTSYAAASHSHGNITNAGAIGSTSGLVVTTTTNGILTTSSRSGIDSRTSFPNSDVTAATSAPTVSTIVKRDSDGASSFNEVTTNSLNIDGNVYFNNISNYSSNATFTYNGSSVTTHRTALNINNVDNTSDANKPISDATQSALNSKSDIGHGHSINDVSGLQTALDSKANLIDPVRTTLTGDGTLSTFPISGASGLVNPSALIVAIDGILQEPSVDYTVASGNITFTSPLPNGSKAVIISPTNTLQVSNVIPSDGSVTSAKIAGGVSISEPIITNGVFNYNTSAADAHRTALNLTSVSTTSPEALQSRVYSNSLLPYPTISFFDDCDARYSYETSGGGTAFYSDNTSIYIHGAIRVASTTTLNNRTSAVRRITGGIKGPGTVYQTVFAIENIADMEMFTGFTWVGLDSNAFGLAYRSGLDGGLFTFRQGFTYIPIPNSTAAPQSGNFQSGPRYKFTMIQNTTTESRVIIEEALSNSATWTVLHDGLVIHSARNTAATLGMNPSTIVTTKTNGQRAVWVDYFMFRNDTYVR